MVGEMTKFDLGKAVRFDTAERRRQKMEPFAITCNQCKSEEVFFYVRGTYLVIYCDHCPMQFRVKLVEKGKTETDLESLPMFKDTP